jgi:hypothetical protein
MEDQAPPALAPVAFDENPNGEGWRHDIQRAEDDLIEAARTLLTVRHHHDGKVVKAPTMGERQAVADAARIARSAAGALERAWEALRRI